MKVNITTSSPSDKQNELDGKYGIYHGINKESKDPSYNPSNKYSVWIHLREKLLLLILGMVISLGLMAWGVVSIVKNSGYEEVSITVTEVYHGSGWDEDLSKYEISYIYHDETYTIETTDSYISKFKNLYVKKGKYKTYEPSCVFGILLVVIGTILTTGSVCTTVHMVQSCNTTLELIQSGETV